MSFVDSLSICQIQSNEIAAIFFFLGQRYKNNTRNAEFLLQNQTKQKKHTHTHEK